jgi:hypothetical protein
MADRDRAQAVLQAEVDRTFVPGCLANVNNTVDVLAPTVADLIRQAREEGRREGMTEAVAHLDDVAAEARTGRDAGYPEESEGMGPTRWCLVTDRAHSLAKRYADGQGVPVPDGHARLAEHAREARRERGRHAGEVLDLKRALIGERESAREWKSCFEARDRQASALAHELHTLRTIARRRELTLVDRLRRRGEHLRTLEATGHGPQACVPAEFYGQVCDQMHDATATARRLNRRAQAAESALARVRREAESWGLPGRLVVPAHSPLRIAKAVGVSVGQAAVRLRSLGEENQRLRRQLDLAMRFEVGQVVVAPHREGWRCSWPDPEWPGSPGQGPTLTEDHPDRFDALVRAAQIWCQFPAE